MAGQPSLLRLIPTAAPKGETSGLVQYLERAAATTSSRGTFATARGLAVCLDGRRDERPHRGVVHERAGVIRRPSEERDQGETRRILRSREADAFACGGNHHRPPPGLVAVIILGLA